MEVPNCIGFIMDGNRRWAKEKGLPTLVGHKKGLENKFQETLVWIKEAGIKNAIFYAFSTENWNRSSAEIKYLMDLFENTFESMLKLAHKHKTQVRFLGQIERFSKKIQMLIKRAEDETKNYSDGVLCIALSYGGRADIVQATNKLLKRGIKEVTEEEFARELWTNDIPDPDLIVRTGEAMRLSNFLTWQSAYSELYFTATLWPDFDKDEFDYILESYEGRNRRRGK